LFYEEEEHILKRILSISAIAAALFAAVAFTPVQGAFAQNAPQAPVAAPAAEDQDTAALNKLKVQLKKNADDVVSALSSPDAQKIKTQMAADVTALAQLKQDYAKAKAANGDVAAIEAKYKDTVLDTVKQINDLGGQARSAAQELSSTLTEIQFAALLSGQKIDKAEIEAILKPIADASAGGDEAMKAIEPIAKAASVAVRQRHKNGEHLSKKDIDDELGKAAAADLASQ
jgi:hypothetical protein